MFRSKQAARRTMLDPSPITDIHRPIAAAPAERIHTLDVLRGIAICGILLMNIHGMGDVADYPLTGFPAAWNGEWIAWGVQTIFVQGAMRGLFTILFGASMLIMLRRAEGAGARSTSGCGARSR